MKITHDQIIGKIDLVARFFLYVLIFWLPYSPAVVESCVITCLILWFVKRGFIAFKNVWKCTTAGLGEFGKSFIPARNELNRPIVVFLIICLFSVVGSIFRVESFADYLTKTCEWFVIFLLVLEVFNERKHIKIAFTILFFTTFATTIDSFFQYYISGKDVFYGRLLSSSGRATAAFKTPNGLGAYLALLIPLSACTCFLKSNSRLKKIMFGVVAVCLVWSTILTFSRGAWVAVLFGLILLKALSCCERNVLSFKKVFGSIIFAVLFIAISVFTIKADRGQGRIFNKTTINWRVEIWKDSLRMIKDKPVFGHGIGSFMNVYQGYRSLNDENRSPTYAHNCFIQLAVETGIVGLIGFLWILARLFKESFKALKEKGCDENLRLISLGLLAGIFTFLVHSFVDTHFYSLQLSVFLWVMIGFQVAINRLLRSV